MRMRKSRPAFPFPWMRYLMFLKREGLTTTPAWIRPVHQHDGEGEGEGEGEGDREGRYAMWTN